MSNRSYADDRRWSDDYIPQLKSILNPLLPYATKITVAPVEQDNKEATDLIINSTIACRVRDITKCKYLRDNPDKRDLTLRVHRDTGYKTELAKIKEGYASRYLYAWTDMHRNIVQWIFVDLDKLRASGLLDVDRPHIPNGDGTYFVAITLKELFKAGCIIATHLTNLKVTSILPNDHEWHIESFMPRRRNKKSNEYTCSLWQPVQQQDLWEVSA